MERISTILGDSGMWWRASWVKMRLYLVDWREASSEGLRMLVTWACMFDGEGREVDL